MDQETPRKKIPSKLKLLILLSGTMTTVISQVYIAMSVYVLMYKLDCPGGSENQPEHSLWRKMIKVYFIEDFCPASMDIEVVTSKQTVYELILATIAASMLSCFASVTMVAAVYFETLTETILTPSVVVHIISCIICLVVDITTAAHFGMDYTALSDYIASGLAIQKMKLIIVRQGAFMLMGVAMKGYFWHVMNMVLLLLIAIYLPSYRKLLKRDEHPLRKLGPIEAFETLDAGNLPRDPLAQHLRRMRVMTNKADVNNAPLQVPGPLAPSIVIDDPLAKQLADLRKAKKRNGGNNGEAIDRSDSWNQPSTSTGRPFSYVPVRLPPMYQNTADDEVDPWAGERDIPDPDYSPRPAQRLKSALKITNV